MAFLLDLKAIHHDYPIHVVGVLDLPRYLDDRAVRNVILDDLDDAALTQKGRGVFDDDYFWH